MSRVPSKPDDSNGDVSGAATALIEEAIASHPVVIFTKQDCEYCALAERTIAGSISRLSRSPGCAEAKSSINPVIVLLGGNSVGLRAREVLANRTNASTLPRVFLRGQCIGGATETVQFARAGMLGAALRQIAGCTMERPSQEDSQNK